MITRWMSAPTTPLIIIAAVAATALESTRACSKKQVVTLSYLWNVEVLLAANSNAYRTRYSRWRDSF